MERIPVLTASVGLLTKRDTTKKVGGLIFINVIIIVSRLFVFISESTYKY